jgi:hypothetical protein
MELFTAAIAASCVSDYSPQPIDFILEEFEDTKGIIRIRISKNRKYDGQK